MHEGKTRAVTGVRKTMCNPLHKVRVLHTDPDQRGRSAQRRASPAGAIRCGMIDLRNCVTVTLFE